MTNHFQWKEVRIAASAITHWLVLALCILSSSESIGEISNSYTLDEAVAVALEQSPEIGEANSRLAEAEARLTASRSPGLPWIRARGTYDYLSPEQRLFPATRNGEPGVFGRQVIGGEVVVGYSLYTGGRVSAEVEAAQWSRASAEAQLTRVKEDLVYRITALFYDLLSQEEILRSLGSAVEAMDEQLRTTQDLVNAGKAARVDLLRTEVRRAGLYELQIRERNNRTIQQRAWAALLGLEDMGSPRAQGSLEVVEHPQCPESETCMVAALQNRSDYRAAQNAVAAREAAVRAARAGARPTLSAQASIGARWMPDASEVPSSADQLQDVARVGIVADFSILDGNLNDARVAEQRALLQGAQERLRKLELQIRFEIESALSHMATSRERVQTATRAIGQAAESFRIVKERYDLGRGTLNDVLDAQADLVAAQTNYARALADLAVSDAQLRLATGVILK